MQLATIDNQQTMSSREIAALTGKDHSHVMRDIRNMISDLEKDNPNLDSAYKSTTYKVEGQEREYQSYELTRDLTLTLVSGYNANLRYKIVQRWQELEFKPKTALELAREQVVLLELIET